MKSKRKNGSRPPTQKNPGKNSTATNPLPPYKLEQKQAVEGAAQLSILKDFNPSYAISSRLRQIGNSKGIILPNRVIEEARISPDAAIVIQVREGVILITETKSPGSTNTDLSTWDAQFKNAIKKGKKPEPDLWKGLNNRFDEEDWT